MINGAEMAVTLTGEKRTVIRSLYPQEKLSAASKKIIQFRAASYRSTKI